MGEWQIIQGDAVERLREIEDGSCHALVTDPPAGISFMSKGWDSDKGGRDQWIEWLTGVMREALRVLKPGAHALVWALPRTSHWTATAVEDAGFEIRDVISHLFGSGFPKSLDVSKAIDAASGVGREVVGSRKLTGKARVLKGGNYDGEYGDKELTEEYLITAPATPAAQQWEGWGTALKPATEHWILARKPLAGMVAANVLEHGTGGINVAACRVAHDEPCRMLPDQHGDSPGNFYAQGGRHGPTLELKPEGRWPPNLLLSHSARCEGAECVPCCPVFQIGEQSGIGTSGQMSAGTKRKNTMGYGGAMPDVTAADTIGDTGTAARFFPTFRYEPKPSTTEREQGVEHMEKRTAGELTDRTDGTDGLKSPRAGAGRTSKGRANTHPTVKSVALMQWLCRLITPPGGTIPDPFCGSGSTGIAALREGFSFIGIELDPGYAEVARNRIIGDAPLLNVGRESSLPPRGAKPKQEVLL